MTGSHTAKLSAMMFLEFFIWGAWLPLIFGYLPSLGFDSTQQSWILNAFTIGAFTALFFSTQFADRNFAAQRFVAVSHLIGGLAILALAWTHTFWPFFCLMLLHSLFYVPTISITNAIAFAHVRDPKTEFARIRLWGTIGWIAVSWPFVLVLKGLEGDAAQAAKAWTFVAAGLASLLLAALSLALPHTPPRPAAERGSRLAWVEAARLLRHPFVAVLFVVTLCDAAVHQGYFVLTDTFLTKGIGIPQNWVMPVMSLGQVAEIGTMAVLGLVLKRLGWRATMTIGVLGHALRFSVFAFLPQEDLVVASILLHGICYAFFFATVYVFIDEYFPKDARSSAQGLFNVLILGFGPFVGNLVWPALMKRCTRLVEVAAGTDQSEHAASLATASRSAAETVIDFRTLFAVPAGVALAAAVLLLVAFRPPAAAARSDP
jgi:nucleoside transporter